MTVYRLAFLGYGNVGKALGRLLVSKRPELMQRHGLEFLVTGIFTKRHGSAINPEGLDLQTAWETGDLNALSRLPRLDEPSEFIRQCPADLLFEATPVNYQTGRPAIDYILAAIAAGMHVVTANKGPVVHGYRMLSELAATRGLRFLFEATVMDGAPVFSLFRETLPAARLLSFQGILNSTTNMILTRMEAGDEFDQAVTYCQQIGIAETNPRGDIDGWDAAIKTAILATVLMQIPLLPEEVDRQGIGHLGRADVISARKEGKRWKLVCSAARKEGGIAARVTPELVGADSPFYQVSGTTSLVQFETDVLGRLSILETDPGPHTTAYGMLADMLRALGKL